MPNLLSILHAECMNGQPLWLAVLIVVACLFFAFSAGCFAGVVWDLFEDEDDEPLGNAPAG